MLRSRREFLTTSIAIPLAGVLRHRHASAGDPARSNKFSLHSWKRDSRNPIFLPSATYDSGGTQAPFVVMQDGNWWMFYAGIGVDGRQRICLATSEPKSPCDWERLGPILDPGPKDSFDEQSATYPRVHRVNGRWHLYYSGRSNRDTGKSHFSNYWGIGLAQSDDLRNWKKFSDRPVLQADGIKEYPDCESLVGLGNIVELPQADGSLHYRMYYTILPGHKDPNWQANGTWHVIEHKVIAAAHSTDGIEWTDRQLVLDRRRDVPSEDIGVVGLNAWRTKDGFHGIYTALGTKYKSYALAEVTSRDGLKWNRIADPENVSFAPQHGSFESIMVGYPSVLQEGDQLRLFYNGVGGGATGVGMAVAPVIDN